MKNKELVLRRMESIENRLKVLRNALNERDLRKSKINITRSVRIKRRRSINC
jgi:hypothetical protein